MGRSCMAHQMKPWPLRLTSADIEADLRSKKRGKYGNTKCEWRGEKFDSKKEMLRFLVLRDMEKRDEIRNLVRQPEFRLEVNGHLICKYRSDFAYDEEQGPKWNTGVRPAQWRRTVEDVKGYATPEFKIKFALAKALYPELHWITS